MWKRLSLAIVAFLALTAQALGAGSISLSLSQQFDAQGRPLSGGLLYFFVAGTTTPQNAFQDTALTLAYPNPITLDASGRVPSFYLADGLIKIRLADSSGVTIIAADNLLVIGASSGGGGGGSIDATTVLATGDVKSRYGTGTLLGFVRANGRTIGSAVSGATERANADCQALFEYLWTTDVNLVVSSGRGATANADWLANKTIALPDMRGRVIAGLDDMGATAASRLTTAFFGGVPTTLGSPGGAQTNTILTAQLPAHSHTYVPSGAIDSQGSHAHAIDNSAELNHRHATDQPSTAKVAQSGSGVTGLMADPVSALSGLQGTTLIHSHGMQPAGLHSHNFTGNFASTNDTGSNAAFGILPPAMVMTFYMKL